MFLRGENIHRGNHMRHHRIHREKLLFTWFTKNHEIIIGFKQAKRGTCTKCKKSIPLGNSLCDDCFKKGKEISEK